METELTIQQVAQRSGLSVHTLRYYERNGLLEPVSRASNGHRRYSEEDIQRIEFLTKLRATGMPIRQMQEFAALYHQGDSTIAQRRSLLETHQQAVKNQLDELYHHLSVIETKIRLYQQLEQKYLGDQSQQDEVKS
jgi:DNA-binding transcriptional MerR regulator